ncbi:hypothetical protein NDU88_001154 [Pleurodeles waltl]|uniref:Uncharacterized protein n=1 Tax=Pleurodeles waltl TaxID=8319 RepID=A0AAV7P4K1_PLEWA|nr:hypothetical protein NDU88_001154 [Pleurodeles waltl]
MRRQFRCYRAEEQRRHAVASGPYCRVMEVKRLRFAKSVPRFWQGGEEGALIWCPGVQEEVPSGEPYSFFQGHFGYTV